MLKFILILIGGLIFTFPLVSHGITVDTLDFWIATVGILIYGYGTFSE
jgi:hypothetical protein